MEFKIFDSHAKVVYTKRVLLMRIDSGKQSVVIYNSLLNIDFIDQSIDINTHNPKSGNSDTETIVVTIKEMRLTAFMNSLVSVTTFYSLCSEKRLRL